MSQWNNDTISSLSSVVRSVLNEEDGSKTETEAARKRQKGKKVSFEENKAFNKSNVERFINFHKKKLHYFI